MKYNNDCNINVVSIGEKVEDYLVENLGRFTDEGDKGQTVVLEAEHRTDYHYTLVFEDTTDIGLPKTLFNSREQSYIEGVATRQPIVYVLGCKEGGEGEQ